MFRSGAVVDATPDAAQTLVDTKSGPIAIASVRWVDQGAEDDRSDKDDSPVPAAKVHIMSDELVAKQVLVTKF